jgi:hypothetical protein
VEGGGGGAKKIVLENSEITKKAKKNEKIF